MRREQWTIRTLSGEAISAFVVEAEPLAETPQPASQPAPAQAGNGGGERMTDPQKRYLFRLLAAQNVTGKQAEEHLKQYFKVTKLTEIPKSKASEYINQLVGDRKEAAS
jgi:hypothetical protein